MPDSSFGSNCHRRGPELELEPLALKQQLKQPHAAESASVSFCSDGSGIRKKYFKIKENSTRFSSIIPGTRSLSVSLSIVTTWLALCVQVPKDIFELRISFPTQTPEHDWKPPDSASSDMFHLPPVCRSFGNLMKGLRAGFHNLNGWKVFLLNSCMKTLSLILVTQFRKCSVSGDTDGTENTRGLRELSMKIYFFLHHYESLTKLPSIPSMKNWIHFTIGNINT